MSLSMSYPKGHIIQKNLGAVGLRVGVPGVLPTWDVVRTSWQDMAALWKDMCVLWPTWIEYKGTSNHGSGLWNMFKWDFRKSQSAWETRSYLFWPLMDANSKGPWMKVSRCVITCGAEHSQPMYWTDKWGVCRLMRVETEACLGWGIGASSIDWAR